MRARAELHVEAGTRAPRLRWRSDPPILLRPTGPGRVHLVQGGGGPLGGDDLALAVALGPDAALELRTVAASVVQPAGTAQPAHWALSADVADGAALRWCPEPTVICDGADLVAEVVVSLHVGACAVLREVVVLGRHGERGGRYQGRLSVDVDGAPLLTHAMLLDGADPALCGPAGTGGHRVVGTLVVAGAGAVTPAKGAGEAPGLHWACTPLAGPGWILLALGDSAGAVAGLLDVSV